MEHWGLPVAHGFALAPQYLVPAARKWQPASDSDNKLVCVQQCWVAVRMNLWQSGGMFVAITRRLYCSTGVLHDDGHGMKSRTRGRPDYMSRTWKSREGGYVLLCVSKKRIKLQPSLVLL